MAKGTVVKSLVYRRDDGLQASIYGACPWQSEAEKARWTLVERGYTVRWDDGRVGCYAGPWPTPDAVLAALPKHDITP